MIREIRQRAFDPGRSARRWLLRGCIGLALLPCGLAAEQVRQIAGSPALDAYANKVMQVFDPPGMSVVMVNGDNVATYGYGVRKLGAPAKVDAHTIFPIGSNTKAFTAAALAILVDEGKLHWDDLMVDKLPGFRMYDPYTSSQMTVTDLLVHRSGLGLGQGDLMIFPGTDRTRADVVHDIRFLKPASSFRAKYDYDNVLYIVAGQLVEAVSGQRWEDFVQQHILNPTSMHDTQTSIDTRVPDQASLHARNSTAVRGVGTQSVLTTVLTGSTFAPAGALQVSAADMGRWLQLQLRHGLLDDGKRVFSEAASQALWMPHTLIPIRPVPASLALTQPQFQAYALGLEVQDYRGHKIITHGGGVLGGVSIVVIIPEKNAAFAIMLNSEDGGALLAMRAYMLDSLLGLPSPDWIAAYKQVLDGVKAGAVTTLKERAAASHPRSGPSLPLSGYVGEYRDPWYGTTTITQDNGGKGALSISFDRTPGLHGTLEHTQYDTFRTHWAMPNVEDAYVTFALKPDGSVDRVTMNAVSPTADFSWDYQDLRFTPVRASK